MNFWEALARCLVSADGRRASKKVTIRRIGVHGILPKGGDVERLRLLQNMQSHIAATLLGSICPINPGATTARCAVDCNSEYKSPSQRHDE